MTPSHEEHFMGEEKEFVIQYIKAYLKQHQIDYFIYGHRHLALDIPIQNSRYFNTGDWLKLNTYLVFKEEPELVKFKV